MSGRKGRAARALVAGSLAIACLASGCGPAPDERPITGPAAGLRPAPSTPETPVVAHTTFILGCGGQSLREPKEIILSCADAGYAVAALRWQGWGTVRAVATGIAVVNTCNPACSAGNYEQYSVTLVLDRIRILKGTGAFYRRLTVVASDGASAGLPAREIYRLSSPYSLNTDAGPAAVG